MLEAWKPMHERGRQNGIWFRSADSLNELERNQQGGEMIVHICQQRATINYAQTCYTRGVTAGESVVWTNA